MSKNGDGSEGASMPAMDVNFEVVHAIVRAELRNGVDDCDMQVHHVSLVLRGSSIMSGKLVIEVTIR